MKTWQSLSVVACAVAVLGAFGVGHPSAQTSAPPTSSSPAKNGVAPAAAKSAGKPYYIEFRSRSAHSYGHTFAVFGRVGQKLTKSNVVGLHPATESTIPWVVGHFIPVPSETGWSDGDIEDQYITARYRVLLTAAEYKKLSAYVEKVKANSPVWHAILYNCNAFVGDIAGHMGLRVPPSSMVMPIEYITELKELNSGTHDRSALRTGSKTAQ